MVVNVHKAKTSLSALIAQVEEGEEVIIARNGKPAVKLVVVAPEPKSGKRRLGTMHKKFRSAAPRFRRPLEEHKAEMARLFEESKLFPDEE